MKDFILMEDIIPTSSDIMTTALTTQQIKQIAREIIEASWPIVLTTLTPEGFPLSRAMTNLHGTDRLPAHSKFFAEQGEWNIFFRTKRSSEKVKHIQHNARAATYFCDTSKMAGLDLIGRIEVSSDPHVRKILWREDWECFFYGPDDPEYRILKFHTESLRLFIRLPDAGFEKVNMSIADLQSRR
jgi:general stress protein 26